MITYLSNNIPRTNLNPLQNTNQRLSNNRPNLQRRKLISTGNQLPTRHNQCILASSQISLRFLNHPRNSISSRLRRRDQVLNFNLDDG